MDLLTKIFSNVILPPDFKIFQDAISREKWVWMRDRIAKKKKNESEREQKEGDPTWQKKYISTPW